VSDPEPVTGNPESLADLAGRRMALVGALSLPGYAAGAVLSDGLTRWLLAAVAVLFAVPALLRARSMNRREAPFGVLSCLVVIGAWAWLVPTAPLLAVGSLLASTVYLALMAPRPHAEIGLGALTMTYLVSQLTLAAGVSPALEVAAVAVTMLGVGLLLLSLRVVTERKVAEHTAELTAANTRLDQLHRTAHRARQPAGAGRPADRRLGAARRRGRAGRRTHDRHRPLQAVQRSLRAPGRRPLPAEGVGGGGGRRRGRPGRPLRR
jgi:hypothetical protein